MSEAVTGGSKPRGILFEFLIYFCVGFVLMGAYWLLQGPPSTPAQTEVTRTVIHGAPILSAGSKTAAADVSAKGSTAAESSAPAKSTESAKAPANTEKKGGEEEESYQYVSFQTLGGYLYEPPDADAVEIPGLPKPKNEIPASIKAYHGKKVHLQGFMVPIQYSNGAVKSFVLCQNLPQCCFGDSLRMNQWVVVKMAGGKTTQSITDQTVMVWGKLDVGEIKDQGVVLSLYRLEAEQVSGPPEL